MTDALLAITDPDRLLDAALAARDDGRAAEAIPAVERALRRHSNDARLHHLLGLLHHGRGDTVAALPPLREAARLMPESGKIADALALMSLEAGLPATALFERAVHLLPGNEDALIGRAAAQAAEGRAPEAITVLEGIVAANPGWRRGQSTLARMRWTNGQSARLFDGYTRALAARPKDAALWTDLLNLLVELGQFAQIDGLLTRARSTLGDASAFPIFEAIAASELRDDERAERLFRTLATIPEPEVVVRHMRHMLRTGRPAEAASRGEPLLTHAHAAQIWPYMAIAWRLTADPRHDWLERQPGLIGVHDLAEPLSAIPDLVPLLRRLHTQVAHPIGQSVRGGTQTDGPLFRRIEPEIVALRALIARTVAEHVKDWPRDPTHPTLSQRPPSIDFAGSWSVRLTGASKGHHSNHIHPQGWISSALYLALPDEAERGPAPAGWLALGEPPAELGLDLAPLQLVEPRFGRLVLFPSTMWHGTKPFGAGERLTVAFDVTG